MLLKRKSRDQKTAEDMLRLIDDPGFWAEMRKIVVTAALPIFQTLIMAGMEEAMLEAFSTKAINDHLYEIGQKIKRTELMPVDQDLLTSNALITTEYLAGEWWDKLEDTTRRDLRTAISTTIREGESTDQLIKRIEPTFGKARARRIAITESTRAMTEGQLMMYDQLGVTQLRWKSVHDSKVCPVCQNLEDTTRETPMTRGMESITPPAHPGCRCRLSPVFDDEPIPTAKPVTMGMEEAQLGQMRPLDPVKDKAFANESREKVSAFLRRNKNISVTNEAFRSEAKQAVVNRLNARLANDPVIKKVWGSGKRLEGKINKLISKWANTSADSDPYAIAIQRAIAKEFGLSTRTMPRISRGIDVLASDIWYKEGKALRRLVRVMYEETQSELAANGINELALYRGMNWEKGKTPSWAKDIVRKSDKEIDITEMPLSSFSNDPYIARAFATETPGGTPSEYIAQQKVMIRIQVVVPRENILSTPWTGFGCLSEKEFTVLQSVGKALVSRL